MSSEDAVVVDPEKASISPIPVESVTLAPVIMTDIASGVPPDQSSAQPLAAVMITPGDPPKTSDPGDTSV